MRSLNYFMDLKKKKKLFLFYGSRVFKSWDPQNKNTTLIKCTKEVWLKLEGTQVLDSSSTGENYKNITLLTLSPYNTSVTLSNNVLTQKQSMLTKSLSLTNSHSPITLTPHCLSLSLITLPLSLLFPFKKLISQVRVLHNLIVIVVGY